MISCLKLYAAPLVLLIEAAVTKVAGNTTLVIVLRLVVAAAALTLSIYELRDGRRRRNH